MGDKSSKDQNRTSTTKPSPKEGSEFSFLISAPPSPENMDTYVAEDGETKAHGAGREIMRFLQGKNRKVTVNEGDVQDFLQGQLVPLGNTIAAEAGKVKGGFHVDEISLTIGVGLEGGLSFVAKASAEAAISVTLRRA